jgi:hypothetical protein
MRESPDTLQETSQHTQYLAGKKTCIIELLKLKKLPSSRQTLFHRPILVHSLLRLPSCVEVSTILTLKHDSLTLEPTANREKCGIDGAPRYQNAKIQANPRVQVKQDLSTALHNGMQRPSVSPPVKRWCNFDVVKGRGDVCDDPEDQKETHPTKYVRIHCCT